MLTAGELSAAPMLRAITFQSHDTQTGARIGGRPPIGMDQQFRDKHTQYFGTFPVENDLEFSIFHRFEIFDDDASRDVIDFNNQILMPSKMIWSIVHKSLPRDINLPAAFPGLGLGLSDFQLDHDDVDTDLAERPLVPENKMMGRCYIERHAVIDDILELEAADFIHLLQIGHDFLVDAEGFPWDPGCLNVWCLDATDPTTYRFCIQQ